MSDIGIELSLLYHGWIFWFYGSFSITAGILLLRKSQYRAKYFCCLPQSYFWRILKEILCYDKYLVAYSSEKLHSQIYHLKLPLALSSLLLILLFPVTVVSFLTLHLLILHFHQSPPSSLDFLLLWTIIISYLMICLQFWVYAEPSLLTENPGSSFFNFLPLYFKICLHRLPLPSPRFMG